MTATLDHAAFEDLAADLAEELGRMLSRRHWRTEQDYAEAFAVGPGIDWESSPVRLPARVLAVAPAAMIMPRQRARPRCRRCGYLRARCNCQKAAA